MTSPYVRIYSLPTTSVRPDNWFQRQPPFESNSVGGPSRVGGVYDRVPPGTHAPYSHDHGYPDTVESPHNVNRRVDRTPSYYTSSPSAGYFASPHAENDSRQGRWNRDTTWYGSEPHSAASTTYTPRRPSPPPTHTVHPRTYESPTSQPTYPNYQEWRTSSPRTSAHWDERRTWEPARDERIHEHASWRHTRTESGSRLFVVIFLSAEARVDWAFRRLQLFSPEVLC